LVVDTDGRSVDPAIVAIQIESRSHRETTYVTVARALIHRLAGQPLAQLDCVREARASIDEPFTGRGWTLLRPRVGLHDRVGRVRRFGSSLLAFLFLDLDEHAIALRRDGHELANVGAGLASKLQWTGIIASRDLELRCDEDRIPAVEGPSLGFDAVACLAMGLLGREVRLNLGMFRVERERGCREPDPRWGLSVGSSSPGRVVFPGGEGTASSSYRFPSIDVNATGRATPSQTVKLSSPPVNSTASTWSIVRFGSSSRQGEAPWALANDAL